MEHNPLKWQLKFQNAKSKMGDGGRDDDGVDGKWVGRRDADINENGNGNGNGIVSGSGSELRLRVQGQGQRCASVIERERTIC